MRQHLGTVVAVAVALLLGAFIWFYERELPTTDELKATERHLVPVHKAEDVVGFSFLPAAGGGWTAGKPDGAGDWKLLRPVEDLADPAALDRVLAPFLGQDTLDRLTLAAGEPLAPLGLDTPVATVRLAFTDGAVVEVLIGSEDPRRQGRYAMVRDAAAAHLVAGLDGELLTLAPVALRKKELVGMLAFRANRLVVRSGDRSVSLAEDRAQWSLTAPVAMPIAYRVADSLLQGLSQLEATRIVDDTLDSAAAWGLASPRAVLTLRDEDTPLTVIRVGNLLPDSAVAVSVEGRPSVYAVPAEFAAALSADPLAYVARTLSPYGMYDLKRIEIRGEGRTDTLARSELGEWQGTVEGAAEAVVGGLIGLPLADCRLLEGTDPPRPVGEAAYAVALETFSGKTLTVYLWRDGGSFIAWREGEPVTGRVEGALFGQLLTMFRGL